MDITAEQIEEWVGRIEAAAQKISEASSTAETVSGKLDNAVSNFGSHVRNIPTYIRVDR